jgi:hypothetical protein
MEDKKEGKPKRGRPAKEKEKLNCSINLKLTEKDFGLIKEKAEKIGMKATRYAREMVLKARFTLEELDLMRKLSGIANNLNQVAKKANQSGYIAESINIMGMMIRIKRMLDDR